jgi:cytochrome c-type biogenesis protein CcmI
MIYLWFGILLAIALAFILPPLLQREEKTNANEVREANVAVYRDQLRELEADLQNGILNREQYEQDREEFERRLLEDVSSDRGKVANPGRGLRRWGVTFLILGIGSFLLPLVGLQFHVIISLNEALGQVQPGMGICFAVFGGFLLFLGFWRLPAANDTPKLHSTNRNTAYALALALPILSISLYLKYGNQNARSAAPAAADEQQSAAPFASQSGEMSSKQNPTDAKGWAMLARSYVQMQKYKDAAEAYEHATSLASNDADLWADYAYAVAMINGGEYQGKPMDLINKALQVDPNNREALTLAGNAAFNQKNYNQAIQFWEKVLKSLPPKTPEVARPLTERIAEAKRLAKGASNK